MLAYGWAAATPLFRGNLEHGGDSQAHRSTDGTPPADVLALPLLTGAVQVVGVRTTLPGLLRIIMIIIA